jgi:hypothetical protein
LRCRAITVPLPHPRLSALNSSHSPSRSAWGPYQNEAGSVKMMGCPCRKLERPAILMVAARAYSAKRPNARQGCHLLGHASVPPSPDIRAWESLVRLARRSRERDPSSRSRRTLCCANFLFWSLSGRWAEASMGCSVARVVWPLTSAAQHRRCGQQRGGTAALVVS